MKLSRAFWIGTASLWISVILFSSTAVARRWSEQAFHSMATASSRHVHLGIAAYDPLHFLAEKCVHVTLFMVFAIVLANAIPQSYRKVRFILLIGAIVGSGSELLQRAFPGRDPALRDVGINIAATALGALISLWFFRTRPQTD
jgi:VanZ family protein